MNWTAVIKDIEKKGKTQADIAARLRITPGAVSRLRSGSRTEPRWRVGNTLLQMHSELGCKPRRASSRV